MLTDKVDVEEFLVGGNEGYVLKIRNSLNEHSLRMFDLKFNSLYVGLLNLLLVTIKKA